MVCERGGGGGIFDCEVCPQRVWLVLVLVLTVSTAFFPIALLTESLRKCAFLGRFVISARGERQGLDLVVVGRPSLDDEVKLRWGVLIPALRAMISRDFEHTLLLWLRGGGMRDSPS